MENILENFSRKSFQPSINNEGTYKLYISLIERNKKSIVAKNFDKETSIDEIEKLFSKFGIVNKVTMICDKYTGVQKG